MAERVNELTELHPDKQLALRIENGEVTQDEVNHIWAETRDLSAQTDFDTRRAVVALRKCGSLNDAWPVFFTQLTQMMSEMRGSLVRGDSKAAHLVAGTETIVRELQKVGPLASNLEDLKRSIRYLTEEVRELRNKPSLWQRIVARFRKPTEGEDYDPYNPQTLGGTAAEPQQFIDDAERARKETIGSAWAK